MNEAKMKEVAQAASQAAVDVVKRQVAKGAPDAGVSKARHAAIVADVLVEVWGSFPTPTDVESERWLRMLFRAACSTDLLNASQLRQRLEKDGVLRKETAASEYGLD